MVHFGFEMADEFTSNTFPFQFTIPPASLDPSVPWPGPYLFHGGGMQNLQYPLLSTNALQFMPAISLRSTSSSAASSTSTGESSENSPTEGSVDRNRCPNWSDAEIRFLLEIWRDSLPKFSRRRNSGAWDTIAKKLNPHCLVLTAIADVLLLDCPDYQNPLHPLHLSRHKSHPVKETSSPSEKYGQNQ